LASTEDQEASDLVEIATNDTKSTAVVVYTVTDETIDTMSKKFFALTVVGANDKKGMSLVHEARMKCVRARSAVEKTRKQLKADSLEYCRKVDAEAKRLSAKIEHVEKHLAAQEKIVQDEIDRIEAAKVEATRKQRESRFLEAGGEQDSVRFLMQYSDDEFESLVSQTEQKTLARLEQARVAAEQAEAMRIAREQIEAERAELARQQQAEADRVAAERAAIERERQAAEAESARLRASEDASRAAERTELDRQRKENEAAAEKLRVAEENRLAAERAEAAKQQAAIDAEALRIANEEAARLRAIENERIAREAAEAARIETEARLKREAEAEKARLAEEAAEAERKEAMRPDLVKLLSVAVAVRGINVPSVSGASHDIRSQIVSILEDAAMRIEAAAAES